MITNLLNSVDKVRNEKRNLILGFSLAFIAGAINAGGFMVIGIYTSHMTGMASMFADSLALDHFNIAVQIFLYIICFILGAAFTSALVMFGRKRNLHSQFALPLLVEALILLVFAFADKDYFNLNLTIATLCLLMGLQNAVITKISGFSIRTTHITGMATDIGIELGKLFYIFGRKDVDHVQVNATRLRVHIAIILFFLTGGVIGAFSFQFFGNIAALPLALYLLLICIKPLYNDIKKPA